MKKILLGFGVLVAVVLALPMLAAFEAHVVNVTATIENALSVPIESLNFGTVFPQEYLEKNLDVSLSQSFINEGRVDDVEYFIRQKPKCGITEDFGTVLIEGSTVTGHVYPGLIPDQYPNVATQFEGYYVDCGPEPVDLTGDQYFGLLPSLCEYISKHPDDTPDPTNDARMPSFHQPFIVDGDVIRWNDTTGRLVKSDGDYEDNWTIDLAVPCFGGQCAQDWASFVAEHNNTAIPEEYIQPNDNEHKVFGCDLWVEVSGISLPGFGCNDKVDLMLVLDRSGSISGGEMNDLKTAAKAFVDALAPSTDGVHIGQTSFSDNGTLDLHLSDDSVAIKAAIDAVTPGGFTNLMEGINLATGELANPGDNHDRPDAESPDFVVIITDGSPNRPISDPLGDGAAAADAARAAGAEVYVVGVGTTEGTADYLKMEIADDAAHYFDAADFGSLEQILEDLASCQA